MELKNFPASSAVINDAAPSDRSLYSSEKVMSEIFQYEKDIITHKLNVDPDMRISQIISENPVYIFDNENLAYISDIPETTQNGITYKVENGLIYVNGTSTGTTFYVNTDIVIPENVVNQSILANIEVVSGSINAGNLKMQLPVTYKNSGGNEAQMSVGIGNNANLKCIGFTNNQQRLQFQSNLSGTDLVLRPYFAFRSQARALAGWTDKPTAGRQLVNNDISNRSGLLVTQTGNFSAHVQSSKALSPLFGKKLALAGDSIAEGHSGDSFGWTIAERENMSFDKPAIGTARIASTSPVISIPEQVASLTADYDYIIVEGGINDISNGDTLGTMTSGYSDALDLTTTLGGLEQICKTLIENYPGAKKLFVLCHKVTNKNHEPYVTQDTFFEAMIGVLNKWHIPYIDLRQYPLCGYNDACTAAYFGTDAQNGPTLHPNNAGYNLGYNDQITAKLKEI